MNDLIRREDLVKELNAQFAVGDITRKTANDILNNIPSTELEIITIEELSYQLGCTTIQSALYWFEFLKTLDLLGFAIIRKETK